MNTHACKEQTFCYNSLYCIFFLPCSFPCIVDRNPKLMLVDSQIREPLLHNNAFEISWI